MSQGNIQREDNRTMIFFCDRSFMPLNCCKIKLCFCYPCLSFSVVSVDWKNGHKQVIVIKILVERANHFNPLTNSYHSILSVITIK